MKKTNPDIVEINVIFRNSGSCQAIMNSDISKKAVQLLEWLHRPTLKAIPPLALCN
jgi:hypothetical protein